MKVLHLTDLHLDMFYQPGLEAECDTPQCCRPQDIPDVAILTNLYFHLWFRRLAPLVLEPRQLSKSQLDTGERLDGFGEIIKTLFLGGILRCAVLPDDEHAGSHREDER